MKTIETAFKVIPSKMPEQQALVNLWLSIDEIKAKVVYKQTELKLVSGQQSLDLV